MTKFIEVTIRDHEGGLTPTILNTSYIRAITEAPNGCALLDLSYQSWRSQCVELYSNIKEALRNEEKTEEKTSV